MLCDRPTTKAGGRAAADSGMTMPFACAVGPGSKYEALGLNPSREQRAGGNSQSLLVSEYPAGDRKKLMFESLCAAKLASDNKTRPRDNNDFLSKHKQW